MTPEERAKDALRGDMWAPSKECKDELIESVVFHIELSVEAERERCAKIVEEFKDVKMWAEEPAVVIAKAIREQG